MKIFGHEQDIGSPTLGGVLFVGGSACVPEAEMLLGGMRACVDPPRTAPRGTATLDRLVRSAT